MLEPHTNIPGDVPRSHSIYMVAPLEGRPFRGM